MPKMARFGARGQGGRQSTAVVGPGGGEAGIARAAGPNARAVLVAHFVRPMACHHAPPTTAQMRNDDAPTMAPSRSVVAMSLKPAA